MLAVSACAEWSPWEKFILATVIPACSMRRIVSGLEEAGPIVATIFVRDIVYILENANWRTFKQFVFALSLNYAGKFIGFEVLLGRSPQILIQSRRL
jgi:hypothetical protein